jgi:hypothetical protein
VLTSLVSRSLLQQCGVLAGLQQVEAQEGEGGRLQQPNQPVHLQPAVNATSLQSFSSLHCGLGSDIAPSKSCRPSWLQLQL